MMPIDTMWQPNRAQWRILWTVAVLVILAWPPDRGRSLLVKAINRAADPFNSLPALPPPMGLDYDGDAVAAHDRQESEFSRVYASGRITRWRMDLKTARDPIDPQTERQPPWISA
jgi:hypothetical protein